MYHINETFAAAASTIVGWFAGNNVGSFVANTLDLTALPPTLLGPAGALVGVIIALKWMAKRLAAAEAREELRNKERSLERKETQERLIGLIREGQAVTTSAVTVMQEVKDAIQKCPGRPLNHNQD